MTARLALATLILLPAILAGSQAQEPAAAPAEPASDLKAMIGRLASLDYPTRMNAARLVRRAPAPEAVRALTAAVRESGDPYVRYRSLVLLTGFNDRSTGDLMRKLLDDRNDRVREVAYRWLELHPDPLMTLGLLAAVESEQAEFVRPALIRALAAHGADPQVKRALIAETGRGLDFFRSAVIAALGLSKATYAVDALMIVAASDGPLQDDAVLALGRIGDPRALTLFTTLPASPPELVMAVHAARCLLGDDCSGRVAALTQAITGRAARGETVRAAAAGLSALAAVSDDALLALVSVPAGLAAREDAVAGFGGVALRHPERVLGWLVMAPEDRRSAAIEALREAFDRFEEDLAEEQFYATTRAEYWKAADGSATRTLMATIIQKLDF